MTGDELVALDGPIGQVFVDGVEIPDPLVVGLHVSGTLILKHVQAETGAIETIFLAPGRWENARIL
jgi:hypothetical protein